VKVCPDCHRDETRVKFERGRSRCCWCRKKAIEARKIARGRVEESKPALSETHDFPIDIDAREWVPRNAPPTPEATPAYRPPTVPINTVSPPADPLAEAYQNKAERDERRTTKRERDALLEENKRLRAENDAFTRASRSPELLIYRQPEHERSDATACVVASDWHVEEPVIAESVFGLNEFNLEIAKARAERLFWNLVRLIIIFGRESKIVQLYIAAIGDFFSGHIHDELVATNLMEPADACVFFKTLFVAGIRFILKETTLSIVIDFIPGNHGRMTKRIWTNPIGTSLEVVAFHNIADIFENEPRVKINIARQARVHRDFYENYRVRLMHGYQLKFGGGIGGLTIPLRKAIARWDKAIPADLTIMGHWHQRFDGGDFLINGSLIGYNEYAQENGFSPEPPQQQFFLIDARNGGEKSVVAPIWLDEAKRDRADAA